jgi:hypothetical protein
MQRLVLVNALFALVAIGCGSSGSSEPSDSGTGACDVTTLFTQGGTTGYGCAQTGCHDSSGTSANFDMASTGLPARLVGKSPMGGGTLPSVCAGSTPAMVYLDPGSQPATGLFLRKISASPGCGMRMPYGGRVVTATDFACIQSWANGLTKP